MSESKGKPTIEELEAILNSKDDRPVQILPDGSIRDLTPDDRPDAAEQISIIIQSVRHEQASPPGIPNRKNFDDELVCLLNKYSRENGSNTPDFILADFIGRCLENWNLTTITREEWYGRKFSPGSMRAAVVSCKPAIERHKVSDTWVPLGDNLVDGRWVCTALCRMELDVSLSANGGIPQDAPPAP